MISLGSSALRIFVALEPCDIGKGFDGLLAAALAHVEGERLGTDALFVFTNKRRNRVKLLHFDGTGLWVAAKRSWRRAASAGRRPASPRSARCA